MKWLTYLLVLASLGANASDIDFKLKKVIEIYGLTGFDCNAVQNNNKDLTALGEALFESKLLSGGNDTSCSTCHLKDLNRVDGLPLSVGVGGSGEGEARLKDGKGIIVPRNSFTLVGRGHKDYKTYFWDGKVEQEQGRLVSIIGDDVSKGFDSPLALAAVLPILARDEFLGLLSESTSNEMVSIDDSYYEERYKHASKFLNRKILNSQGQDWEELKTKFVESGIEIEKIQLSDIGNAISSFLINKENCIQNNWSKYIKGDTNALNTAQKQGAFLFYGKGRCASCHSGDLLSDFKFHSIATPQGQFGVSVDGQDLGRSEISLKYGDRFKFKTPSLLDVSSTKPYGHNGIFNSLDEVVLFHLNPIPFFKDRDMSKDELYNYGRILASRSELLSYIEIFDEEEFQNLLEFLKTL
ncbi:MULTISPECIES: His-Xaa-Ser system-associated MauG-like protein [unclassified Pseudoalteromonas]|uniref:His-Xaa-Ser system-associated MauG-like protein n=1 Tax=unclassified Pseudoalteromonas TaxID=194690 RepID=UPI0004B16FF4|nr:MULTISPECIES: His-Xaa-Ser system-associated MauG-like protein [unclassified Pseudoalteromonas]